EAVRLDPRDRQAAEHVAERPAAHAIGAAQDLGGGLVVDLERDALLRPPRAQLRRVRLRDVEVDDRRAQRRTEAGGEDARGDRGELLERAGREAAVLEARAVGGLEPGELSREQPRRDV